MNYLLKFNKKNKNQIDRNIIFLCGIARSGTSIIGNILASMKGVEYFFEPETLRSLLFLRNKINLKSWNLIFETYLYQDLIKNRLNARNINFNKRDLSYYFKTKNFSNIKWRIKNNFDIHKSIKKRYFNKIIFKLPDSIDEFIEISKIYKKFNFIFVTRNPVEVVNSILKKKWFSSKINRTFPLIEHKKKYYPYSIKKKNYNNWNKLNHFEKCAFYVIEKNKLIKRNIKNFNILNYDNLLKNPDKFTKELGKKYSLKFTKKTKSLLKTVKKKKTETKIIKKQLKKKINTKLFLELDKSQIT